MPSLVLGGTNVVTAVKAQNGTLELIDWFVDAGGSVLREGSIAAGPITQLAVAPVGSGRVVTLTQDSTGSTKLIAWDVSAAGQFTRRGDVTVGTGNGVVKVTAVSATQVVTAIRTTAGALQVNAFSLTQAGVLAATGQALGPAITDTSIVNTATDRAVTASRLANGNLEVSAWDVDPTGKVALASSSDAGAVDEIALGALGSAKVATAVRQADKTLEVIVWDVVSAVTRLQSNQAGAVGPIVVATLGYDRAVTPVQNGSGQLELIDWADFSLGMLRNAWSGPGATDCTLSGQAPSHASKTGRANVAGNATEPDDEEDEDFDRPEGEKGYTGGISQLWPQVVLDNAGSAPGTDQPSPSAAVVAQPDIQGVDPSIAAGQKYVIATEDHWIEFFDKSGHRLSSKAGEPTCLSAYKFFSGFLAPKNPNGTANRNNINRHLRSPLTYDSAKSCDPNTGAQTPCINEFYDTRVAYDPTIHRFIILSAVRHPIFQDGINDLIVRRFFAFAISRSEDPRDGFDTYISTENNYSDWPRIATAPGQLVVAPLGVQEPGQ